MRRGTHDLHHLVLIYSAETLCSRAVLAACSGWLAAGPFPPTVAPRSPCSHECECVKAGVPGGREQRRETSAPSDEQLILVSSGCLSLFSKCSVSHSDGQAL